MTIAISSLPGNASASDSRAVRRLGNILNLLLAALRPRYSSADRTSEAIDLLRGTSASPDMRDWAERYLCGVEDADARRYCNSRRWQS